MDGKYITSVPITDEGNLRPGHGGSTPRGLSELKKSSKIQDSNRKSSLIDRLSRSNKDANRRATTANGGMTSCPRDLRTSLDRLSCAGPSVFDRLSSPHGSRTSLNSSGLRRGASNSEDLDKSNHKSGALSMIKDLTKTLRKGSKEEGSSDFSESNGVSTKKKQVVVAPRDSRRLFSSDNSASRTSSSPKGLRRVTSSSTSELCVEVTRAERRSSLFCCHFHQLLPGQSPIGRWVRTRASCATARRRLPPT